VGTQCAGARRGCREEPQTCRGPGSHAQTVTLFASEDTGASRGDYPGARFDGGLTGTFHTSAAYSVIVRSAENQPICAILRAQARPQASGWRHNRSTASWAARYAAKSAAII